MEDYALFLKDVKDSEGKTVFEKGNTYLIALEDTNMGLYFINYKNSNRKVAEFPEDCEGELFKIVRGGRYG